MQHKHLPVSSSATSSTELSTDPSADSILEGLASQLSNQENVLCTLAVDLNAELHFANGLVH